MVFFLNFKLCIRESRHGAIARISRALARKEPVFAVTVGVGDFQIACKCSRCRRHNFVQGIVGCRLNAGCKLIIPLVPLTKVERVHQHFCHADTCVALLHDKRKRSFYAAFVGYRIKSHNRGFDCVLIFCFVALCFCAFGKTFVDDRLVG